MHFHNGFILLHHVSYNKHLQVSMPFPFHVVTLSSAMKWKSLSKHRVSLLAALWNRALLRPGPTAAILRTITITTQRDRIPLVEWVCAYSVWSNSTNTMRSFCVVIVIVLVITAVWIGLYSLQNNYLMSIWILCMHSVGELATEPHVSVVQFLHLLLSVSKCVVTSLANYRMD